jgi:hypothetical protein
VLSLDEHWLEASAEQEESTDDGRVQDWVSGAAGAVRCTRPNHPTTCAHTWQPAVYGLEGSISIAGGAVQWLRDKMQMIEHAVREVVRFLRGRSARVGTADRRPH